MNQLNQLLQTMEIPEARRDLTKPENLRWLARNIAINNAEHPNLSVALDEIRSAERNPNPVIAPWEQAR